MNTAREKYYSLISEFEKAEAAKSPLDRAFGEVVNDETRIRWLQLEVAKLRAELQAAMRQSVPDGYVVVPKEPTQAMCVAGQHKAREWPKFPLRISPIYSAMIEAGQVKEPTT